MENKPKPEKVRQAIFKENRRAIQNMARKGGERTALKRAVESAVKEERRKDALEDARRLANELYSTNTEGDVLPPSPESLDNEKNFHSPKTPQSSEEK
ncbi:MAG: hypothetical protein ACYC75_03350 [Minisyncoccota bacterium]